MPGAETNLVARLRPQFSNQATDAAGSDDCDFHIGPSYCEFRFPCSEEVAQKANAAKALRPKKRRWRTIRMHVHRAPGISSSSFRAASTLAVSESPNVPKVAR